MSLVQRPRPQVKSEQILGKQLPTNIEAEKSVLGAILLSDENYGKVTGLLKASDFYLPAHQLIYETISELERINEITKSRE